MTRPLEPIRTAADLVGRDTELGALRAFLAEAAEAGAALLLTGDAGLGKTALLDAAAGAAASAGALVLRATGSEFEADMSFAALNQILVPVLDDFDVLSRTHREALSVALGLREGEAADRLVISTAVLLLLRGLAERRPVLLIVDDMAWVDRSSALVMNFVVRRLTGARVGFLAAVRTENDDLFGPQDLPRYPVAPLSAEAAETLMAGRFPGLADGVRARILVEAQGNPLAILQLPTALNRLQITALQGLPPVLPLPTRLRKLFVERVRALPTPTRAFLLLAVLEGSGDLAILRSVCGGDSAGLMEPALHANLIEYDPGAGTVRFSHPLTRSAVVELATPAERRHAHEVLADHLAGSPDRRAWHLASATSAPDESVASLLEQMADRVLRRGDASRAVAALQRAAELSPLPDDRSRRQAAAHYLDVGITGEPTPAPPETRAGEPSGKLYDAVSSALTLINGDGELLAAHRLVADALTGYAGDDPAGDPAYTPALLALFMLCAFGSDASLWTPYHAAVARLGADLSPELDLLNRTGIDPVRTAASAAADVDRAIAELADRKDFWRVLQVSSSALYTDRIAANRDSLWQIVRGARDGGAVVPAITASGHLCLDDLMRGRWDEGEQLADECIAMCRTAGQPSQLWQAHYRRAMYAACRGDDELLTELSDSMLNWSLPRGVRQTQLAVCHVAGLAALGRSDFEAAYHLLSEISPCGVLPECVPYALWIPMDLVEAAVRSGRQEEAVAHVAAVREAGIARISSRAALLTSGAAALAEPSEAAVQLFDDALALPDAQRWTFDHARIQLAYGERLRRWRKHTQARKITSQALDTFRRLGAGPWAERAGAELRAAGTAVGHASAGASALTPQEREIALMAAAGMTNKEIGRRLFLSHRTVGAHLYRVFPKLGISSRAALRDALAGLGDADDVASS